MAHYRRHKRDAQRPSQSGKSVRNSSAIGLRKVAPGEWELVHPRCARDRADDMEEVVKMIAADEIDVAVDELRWLLEGCPDFLAAHKALGELALLDNDYPLARGHFGHAFRLGLRAIEQARGETVPYRLASNQAFFEAGKGLVHCLVKLGKAAMAADVARSLARCDPSDPLNIRGLLAPG